MTYRLQPGTGALFDPKDGFGSTFAGDSRLPRSIASDGRRFVLMLHVLIHVAALCLNIVSCVFFYNDFVQSQVRHTHSNLPCAASHHQQVLTHSPPAQMRVGAIVAVVLHALGILALLALAAAELKQLAYTVGMSLIFSFLLSALCATVGMMIFTFRSDVTTLVLKPWTAGYATPLTHQSSVRALAWTGRAH